MKTSFYSARIALAFDEPEESLKAAFPADQELEAVEARLQRMCGDILQLGPGAQYVARDITWAPLVGHLIDAFMCEVTKRDPAVRVQLWTYAPFFSNLWVRIHPDFREKFDNSTHYVDLAGRVEFNRRGTPVCYLNMDQPPDPDVPPELWHKPVAWRPVDVQFIVVSDESMDFADLDTPDMQHWPGTPEEWPGYVPARVVFQLQG